MCGRYSLYDDEDYFEIFDLLNELKNKYPDASFSTGEVFPSTTAPVLVPSKNDARGFKPELILWGFPLFNSKGVIINARSETVAQKKMFSEAFRTRRCIIPSTGFFEWSKDTKKKKYLFSANGTQPIYMAGLFSVFNGNPRFVILTKEANKDVADIHNRMPVIIRRPELTAWLDDINAAQILLEKTSPQLTKSLVS